MGCKDCPYRGRKSVPNIVKRADIAIVGESPGRTELEVGVPFVGESGKLLDLLLRYAEIDRNKVAILNAAKCMLDKSKTKEVSMVLKCCKEYLLADLEKVKPKIVIVLGDIALWQMTGRRGITKIKGRPFEHNGYTIIPTFHPSYLLRQGGRTPDSALFRSVVSDLRMAVETLPDERFDYKEGSEIDFTELMNSDIIAVDAEFVLDTGELICVGFSNKEGKARVFFPDKLNLIKQLLETDIPKIVAARPADEHIFLKHGIQMNGKVFDVLTMAHILDENMHKYSLEEVANVWTTMRNIKETAEGMRSNLKEAPKPLIIRYNATDCDATFRCYQAMKKELLKEKSLARYYLYFMMPIQDTFAEVSLHGIPISMERMQEVEEILESEKRIAEAKAIRRLPKSIRQKHAPKVKLSRAELIIDYLFNHPDGLKLSPKKFTGKTGKPSTDEEHLSQFSSYAFVKHLLRWRAISKLLNTYIRNLKKYNVDGFIYPRISFTSTVTGRTAMSKPNFQNIPKRSEFAPLIRSIIRAPDGWLMGEADLSQSELRIIGWLANDPNILGALRQGIDLHRKTASIVTGKPIDQIAKDERQKAKAINFGFIYGMSASGFVHYAETEYGIKISLSEATKIREKFFSKPDGYYMLPVYHAKCISMARTYGYVSQPLGRRRRLPNINSKDPAERARAERQAINFPVQAFSSDLGLIGLMLFHQKVRNRDDIKVLSFIHDAIVFMAKEDAIEEAAELCLTSMTSDAPQYIWDKFKIEVGYPVEAEVKIGKSLAEMKEYVKETS